MNTHSTASACLRGVVATVPSRVIRNADCPDPQAADEAAKLTGVYERRWVGPGQSARTLCTDAAQVLLARMGWLPHTIEVLVYVTQTPDHAVPADVYRIAADLGVGAGCACVQANYSCSGYVYGLWLAMRLVSSGRRALLLVGDATSTIADPGDRATAPLFGDAGSASAIEGGGPVQHFVLGSDGSGADKLCTHPPPSICFGPDLLHMDGGAVFNFTLRTVPGLLADVLGYGQPAAVLMHQANAYILRHLMKKAGVPALGLHFPSNIGRFGNTSCASIPLLLCSDSIGAAAQAQPLRLALAGYGAGWAWAGASLDCPPLKCAELLEV
jgi:3-oxoacyl-[acyl-carrier-protein] synthase-3